MAGRKKEIRNRRATQVEIESEKGISFKVRYDKQTIFEQLSDNLYPDALSAIRELGIQNPFDADATRCSIRIDTANHTITISDDGIGMDLDTILNNFLVIGSSEKGPKGQTPKFKRGYIGSKGIGRLSWQKLGKKAVIRTECQDSAHLIELNKNHMSANVKEVRKKGRMGTIWKIYGTPSELTQDSIFEYVTKRSGILLEKHRDFRIMVNSRSVDPKGQDGHSLKLRHNDFSGEVIFCNKRSKLALTSNHIQIDELDIGGLGGYIDSPLFSETITRDRVVIDEDFQRVMRSFYRSLVGQLYIEAMKDPAIVRDHRELFMELVLNRELANVNTRSGLIRLIPVRVIGKGWKALGDLASGNETFVEYSPVGEMSGKAERAAELGFTVVLTATPLERALVTMVLNAKDTSMIPSETMDSIGKTIPARGKNAQLLLSAGRVVELMTNNFLLGPLVPVTSELQANKEPTPDQVEKDVSGPAISEGGPVGQIESRCLPEPKDYGIRPSYLVHKKESNFYMVNGIKLAICRMDKSSIIALANPMEREIYFNINSPIMKKIKGQGPQTQQALLLEEISHELTHILGYGLKAHDSSFFKVQRKLKYQAIENI